MRQIASAYEAATDDGEVGNPQTDCREAAQIGMPLVTGGVRAVVASDDGQHMLTVPRSSSQTDL